jgi:ketosteroid isomerase-like protein
MSRPYAQLLHRVYADAAGAAGAGQGLASEAEELRRVVAIYREDRLVEALTFLGDESHAVVLTHETFSNGGSAVHYRGVHVWTFENGRCTKFEAFAHALTVFVGAAEPLRA